MELGWIVYTITTLLLVLLAYKKGLKESDNLLKEQLYNKIKQVENEPTGARYWITTKELREILERY